MLPSTFKCLLTQAGFELADTGVDPEVVSNAVKLCMAKTGLSLRSKVTYLTRLRKYMVQSGFPAGTVDATKVPELTMESNKQSIATREVKNKQSFTIPEVFTPERVTDMLKQPEWGISKIACLQVALCCRASELRNMKLEKTEEGVLVYNCAKTDKDKRFKLVSCVEPGVVFNAWTDWRNQTAWIRRLRHHYSYNEKIGQKFKFSSHRLRSIGAQLAVQVAGCVTDAQRAITRHSALRHGDKLGCSVLSYSDITS